MARVSDHFERSEAVVSEIYDRLLAIAETFGPFVEDPKKTSIHLNRRSAFAGVATRRGHLVLTLKSISEVKSERVIKCEQASRNRWYVDIRLTSPADIDGPLIDLIRDSYELSA